MSSGRFTRVVRVLQLVLAHVAFWLLLHPLLSPRDPPPPPLPLSNHEVASLVIAPQQAADPTPASLGAMLDALTFAPTTVPWRACGTDRAYVLRATATATSVPADGFGVLPRVVADNAWLFVNGQFVAGHGSLDPRRPDRVLLRAAWHVPASAWRVGANRVDVVIATRTTPCAASSGVSIAPWLALRAWISWRQLLQREFAWSAVAITSVLALLGFTLWRRGNRERTVGWATVLLASWSLQQLVGAAPSVLPFGLRGVLFTSTRLLLLYALVGLTQGAPRESRSWWSAAFPWVVVACGLIEIVLLLSVADARSVVAWRTASMALDLLLVFVAMSQGLRLVLRDPTVLEQRAPEALILSVLLSLLLLEPLRALFAIGGSSDLSASFALLAIGMALVFAARTAAEYRSVGQVTQLLTSRLAAKEEELATVFAEQRESARQQARLEERTRLMRDMHDGIGGRLLSLEAQLRQAPAPLSPSHVADELRGALDELRLIVDSLDTAGDDLGVALGAFRGRMAPRLRAAGLVLEWSVDEDATRPPLSASAVLDVYRILQEASSNVLRHAGATRFRVALRREADGARVLEMCDNGVGFAPDADTRGRGLANMQARARRLGGALERRDTESGACLWLVLPSVPPT